MNSEDIQVVSSDTINFIKNDIVIFSFAVLFFIILVLFIIYRANTANQSNISLSFSTTFSAGDTIVLASNNQDYPFDYVLTTNLGVGDSEGRRFCQHMYEVTNLL